MNKTRGLWGAALCATALVSLMTVQSAMAQPPRGGDFGRGGPGGGFGGPGGGMREGGMRGMGRSAKGRLERLVMNMGALDRDGKAPLSKAQARRVAAIIAPWRHQPHMDEGSAQRLFTRIDAVLTSGQKSALAARRGRRSGPGGGRGGPDGGRGGPDGGRGGPDGGRGGMREPRGGRGPSGMGGPPSEAQRQQIRASMTALRGFFTLYNPLYTGTYAQVQKMPAPMREGFLRRRQRENAVLAELSRRAA